jgi:hypothetical protein
VIFNIIKNNKYIIIIILVSLLNNSIKAQRQVEDNISFYPKIGYGKPFGGYGFDFETKIKNIGLYIGFGFTPKQVIDTLYTLEKTYNIGGGIEYCFYNRYYKTNWVPKVGIYGGWLNNYINLSTTNYNQYKKNIYGFAISTGLEYHLQKFFFDFNLYIVPVFLLKSSNINPSYTDPTIRLSPSLGIGININKENKTIKKQKNNNYQDEQKTKEHDTINCISNNNNTTINIKGACGNTIIYQQLFDKKYVIIRINPDSILLTSKCHEYNITYGSKILQVFLIDIDTLNDCLCCNKYYNSKTAFNDSLNYEATEGKITILVNKKRIHKKNNNPYYISVKLSNMKFVRKNIINSDEMFFDEIIILNVYNMELCQLSKNKHKGKISSSRCLQ